MVTVGLDIGYSNVKLVFGESEADKPMDRVISPAGAGPADRLQRRLLGKGEDGTQVLVNDEPWISHVEPTRFEAWARELHADYPKSNAYRALYHGALLMTGKSKIDHLVTGLPSSQFVDETRVKDLQQRLEGEHKITPRRKVTVEKVSVVPQPVGAYIKVLADAPEYEKVIDNGTLLVLDPGHFSFDWAVLHQARLDRASIGTSLSASSRVLEEAARLISADHGHSPNADGLETAVRSGQQSVLVYGEDVGLAPYLEEASRNVASLAIRDLRPAIRGITDKHPIDLVVLAGGGAPFYKEAAEEAFPRSKVVIPSPSVLANAEGFWAYTQA